jgi:hypothetical protein
MYSNVFVFDQCRYLCDYVPSIDLFQEFFKDITKQVIIRGCIDCIHRNHSAFNSNLFLWGYIEGIEERFGRHWLPERTCLN